MATLWRQGDWEVECEGHGGRLARVAWRGRELLTPAPPQGAAGEQWGEYEKRPVFGYDDCWPSLEVSAWPGRDRAVRDHGELCWLPWVLAATEQALVGTVSEPGEWTFARTITVADGALRFDLAVSNDGSRPLVMGWAGHALTLPARVTGMELPACDAVTREWPRPEPPHPWPSEIWQRLLGMPRGAAVMLVLRNCHAPVFTLALDGMRWRIEIENVSRPSLGLWYNNAGYPPEHGLEREEFGLEWMLTPECLLEDAAASGSAVTLSAGETFPWAVTWTLEETS